MLNDDLTRKINKSMQDAISYAAACELNRYISVQNAISDMVRWNKSFYFTQPKDIDRIALNNNNGATNTVNSLYNGINIRSAKLFDTTENTVLYHPLTESNDKRWNKLKSWRKGVWLSYNIGIKNEVLNAKKMLFDFQLVDWKDGKDAIEGSAYITQDPNEDDARKHYVIPSPYASLNKLDEQDKTNKHEKKSEEKYVLSIISGLPLNKILTKVMDGAFKVNVQKNYDIVAKNYINKATIDFTNSKSPDYFIPLENRDTAFNDVTIKTNQLMADMMRNAKNVRIECFNKLVKAGEELYVNQDATKNDEYELAKYNLSTLDNFRFLNRQCLQVLKTDPEAFAKKVIKKAKGQSLYEFCVTWDMLDDYCQTILSWTILCGEISNGNMFTPTKAMLPANSYIQTMAQWINGETKIAPYEQRIEVNANGKLGNRHTITTETEVSKKLISESGNRISKIIRNVMAENSTNLLDDDI